MRRSCSILILLAAASSQGCGVKSKHNSDPEPDSTDPTRSTPFLTDRALLPASTSESMTAAQMLSSLTRQTQLYAIKHQAAKTAAGTEDQVCDAIMNAQIVHAQQEKLTISFTVDLTECLTKEQAAGPGWTYQSATLQVYLHEICLGGDFSAFDGRTLGEIGNSTVSCFQKSNLFESVQSYSATAKDASRVSSTTTTYEGRPNQGLCSVRASSGGWVYDDGCVSISKRETTTISAGKSLTTHHYTKLTMSGVTDDPKAAKPVWHAKGQLQTSIDNWTGTVNFAGPTTAPTYKMTSTAGDTATGSVQPLPISLELSSQRLQAAISRLSL